MELCATEMDIFGLMLLMPTNLEPERSHEPHLFVAQGSDKAMLVASLIYDVRRSRPLVVITPDIRRSLTDCKPATVAAELWNCADVVHIRDPKTASTLNTLVPDWVRVYNGATRIYAPGADLSDPEGAHPLVRALWEGAETANHRIVNTVRAFARNRRTHNPEKLLAELQRKHAAVVADLSEARKALNDRPSEVKEPDAPIVFSDPEAQFDHELYNGWLEATQEGDREKWALRPYEIGPEFLASLNGMKTVKRSVIIRACVDVATGRYAEINSREAQFFHNTGRKKANGSNKKVERASDGAAAWRCKVGTGGIALRLMWWECPGDSPEFSLVVEHNDYRIV